jgi:hypothetical protein
MSSKQGKSSTKKSMYFSSDTRTFSNVGKCFVNKNSDNELHNKNTDNKKIINININNNNNNNILKKKNNIINKPLDEYYYSSLL